MGLEATDINEAEMEPTVYLVVQWDSTATPAFAENGPRDELGMMLGRLADDIDARESLPPMYDRIPMVDTNGQSVGAAYVTTSPPMEPADGNPLLIIPVKDLVRTAIVVTDVYTKLQSSIEDVHLLSHLDHSPLAHFYWRDLPALERQWHQGAGTTRESLQSMHDGVRQQLVVQDQMNPEARFISTYEHIERAAESLGLQACLQGFGDWARVGYFRDSKWTGIETEIAWGGKVLTTMNGRRVKGTGYTSDGEWQRDQLVHALNCLPPAHVFTIRGAYGDLAVDKDSGKVFPDLSVYEDDEYRDIVRFNLQGYFLDKRGTPDDLLTKNGEADILDVGFWAIDEDGEEIYEPAVREEGQEHQAMEPDGP